MRILKRLQTLASNCSAIPLLITLAGCAHQASTDVPITLGKIADGYTVGELLYQADFQDKDNWQLQIQASESKTEPKVEFANGMLDIYMPDRGCTAWLKQKFVGPIAITYQILCPTETLSFPEIQARDINNFWHASDPENENALFDPARYNGEFTSYHKMHGYYASTGGGGAEGNHTTRFRRYPRNDLQNNPIQHIALNDRDEDPEYLITPGKWHEVQLVAANGTAQYIVDGKLVYELKEGDTVTVEQSGSPVIEKTYTYEKFPVHNSGYFGLRLVKSHHQYKDLKVYQLKAK